MQRLKSILALVPSPAILRAGCQGGGFHQYGLKYPAGPAQGCLLTHRVNEAPGRRTGRRQEYLLTCYAVCDTVCVVQYASYGIQMNESPFENLRLELRRGSLVLAVLAQLRVEHYGYTLRKALADEGLEMDESTLYPLLRRLETQGLLASEWREEDKRNKRFYRLSKEGKVVLKQLLEEWRGMGESLDRILREVKV